MEQLPQEVLADILERVPVPAGNSADLAQLACVSKSFRAAALSLHTWSMDVSGWDGDKRTRFQEWVAQHPKLVEQMGVFVAEKDCWDWVDRLFANHRDFNPALQFDLATFSDGLLAPLVARLATPAPPRWFARITHLCLEGDEEDLRAILTHLTEFPALEEVVIQFRSVDLAIDLEPDREPFPVRAPLPPKLRVLLAEDAVGRISRALAPLLPPTIEEVALYLSADVVDTLPGDLPNLHTIVAGGSVTGAVLTDLVERCPALQFFSMPIHCFGCDISDAEQFRPNSGLRSFAAWIMDAEELRADLPLWNSKIRDLTLRIEDSGICEVPQQITQLPLERLQLETPGTLFVPDLSKLEDIELFVVRASTANIEAPPRCQMIIESLDDPNLEMWDDDETETEMETETDGTGTGGGSATDHTDASMSEGEEPQPPAEPNLYQV